MFQKMVRITVLVFFLAVAMRSAWADTTCIGDDFTQPIPAEGEGNAKMQPVTLFVPIHDNITDIDIYLDITHTEVSDLLIYLDSPSGSTITLKDDELYESLWGGIQRPNMYGTIFDDQATAPLSSGTPPYTGRFLPAAGHSLSTFNNQDPYGLWTLRISDISLADTGTLDRWEIHIEHAPEPLSLLYMAMGLILSSRPRHQRDRELS